jgi:hypothetical protein
MLLTAFIVLQLVLDVQIALFMFAYLRRRKRVRAQAPAPAEPPVWYREFLLLAEDVLALVEPLLDQLEAGEAATARGARPAPASPVAPAAAAEPAPAPSLRDRHRQAFALLRSGTPPEEVAARERLTPGELRLLANLVAAESELAPAGRS